ncbi:imidazolonepropionase [Thalassobacter stenotrophicus]|uniref:imidazolonepropionase n=1 Tax=Thalassobacter stenotrophicus TaxID=266809 RepID=UPI000D5F05FC|nr:imidazolonepropionase [Thalassobacter stenotrophicus]PVZ48324.1 imidazolonepropionase [Thalassobacter stenotrophicus]
MLLTNGHIATLQNDDSFGLIEGGVIAIDRAHVAWVGSAADLPDEYANHTRHDLEGRLVTPALIDCHTHVVFGGNRAAEFEQRLNGASYAEVAKAGGGIVSTVRATRAASEDALLSDALKRVDAMIAEGVTLIEVKSGYGLDHDTELKMLRVAHKIADARSIHVRASFLGAHAVPAEYAGRPDVYIDEMCIPTLRAAHAMGLVDAVDGFCEGIAFDVAQIERVFAVAVELGLPVKLHAEQLSNIGGTQLATKYAALSADHVEYATDSDAMALAKAGTVAVVLPGAFYTLRETQAPPIQSFRDHGVPMAVATDCNPGSSPLASPLLTMNMACTLFRMTPLEALLGMTAHAATALGEEKRGRITAGAHADLNIWDVAHPAELSYRIGFNPLHSRIFKGSL